MNTELFEECLTHIRNHDKRMVETQTQGKYRTDF